MPKHGYLMDVINPDGSHWYWSTHCRHAILTPDDPAGHEACRATSFPGAPEGTRNPSRCKICHAPCRCECHADVTDTADDTDEPMVCPTTGYVLNNIATVDGRWVCCGGLYPDHRVPPTPTTNTVRSPGDGY